MLIDQTEEYLLNVSQQPITLTQATTAGLNKKYYQSDFCLFIIYVEGNISNFDKNMKKMIHGNINAFIFH